MVICDFCLGTSAGDQMVAHESDNRNSMEKQLVLAVCHGKRTVNKELWNMWNLTVRHVHCGCCQVAWMFIIMSRFVWFPVRLVHKTVYLLLEDCLILISIPTHIRTIYLPKLYHAISLPGPGACTRNLHGSRCAPISVFQGPKTSSSSASQKARPSAFPRRARGSAARLGGNGDSVWKAKQRNIERWAKQGDSSSFGSPRCWGAGSRLHLASVVSETAEVGFWLFGMMRGSQSTSVPLNGFKVGISWNSL